MEIESPLSRDKFLITLDTGRVIELTGLHQSRTYSGQPFGYPLMRFNDAKIEDALERCLSVFPIDCRPVLIPPKITSRPDLPGAENSHGLSHPCVTLPMVTSYGFFDSTPANLDNGSHSALVVVWFQDQFGPPTEPETLEYLREIDWDSRAVDYMK